MFEEGASKPLIMHSQKQGSCIVMTAYGFNWTVSLSTDAGSTASTIEISTLFESSFSGTAVSVPWPSSSAFPAASFFLFFNHRDRNIANPARRGRRRIVSCIILSTTCTVGKRRPSVEAEFGRLGGGGTRGGGGRGRDGNPSFLPLANRASED